MKIYRSNLNLQVFFAVSFLLLIFTGCNNLPSSVQSTLNTTSNQSELIKVIAHYKNLGETLKIDATYYLLESLREQVHVNGAGVIQKRKIFIKMAEIPKRAELANKWDSLANLVGGKSNLSLATFYDSDILKSDLLIKHIDAAFRAWKYPWARDLSFDDFCNYILPYKLVNEEPTFWNGIIQQKTSWLLNSNKTEKDPYKVCLSLNSYLKKQFYFQKFPISWDLNFTDLSLTQCGSCYQATQFTTYYMRAMGLPVVMDFTPLWGNMNGGHNWNALIYKGKPIPFVGAESDPGQTKIDLALQRKRGKVFRYTYKPNISRIKNSDKLTEAPFFLKDPNIIDVTRDYIPVTDICVFPKAKVEEKSIIFLCVFNYQKWTPLDWAEVVDGEAVFKSMGRGIMYLPMRMVKGNLLAVADPIQVDAKGNLTNIPTDLTAKHPFTLRKKGPQGPTISAEAEYDLYYWKTRWVSMGKKVAISDSLVYTLPDNGVFWLKSADKTTKERIFTLEGGVQSWW